MMQGFTGSGELITTHIYGFRAWRITASGWLRPWTFDSSGMVYRSVGNVARCDFHFTFAFDHSTTNRDTWGSHKQHEPRIPDPRCGCGIWAYWSVPPTVWSVPPTVPGAQVIGVIAASGRVLLGPKGLRAEQADIAALYVPLWRWRRRRLLRVHYSGVPIYWSRRTLARRYAPQIESLVPDAVTSVVPLSFFAYIAIMMLAVNWHLLLTVSGIHILTSPTTGFASALSSGGIVGLATGRRLAGRTLLPSRFHRWRRRWMRRWHG